MQNKRDMIGGVLLILIGIGVIIWSIRLQVGTLLRPLSGFFPLLVGFMIIALSLILLSGKKSIRPLVAAVFQFRI